MKKTISIILVLVMVLSMTAFAVSAATVEGNFAEDKGSITINKYNEDNKYSIYRMLDLESFSTAGEGLYSYVVNSAWTDFFAAGGAGLDYVTITNGYVTWKTGVVDTKAVEFAEKALKFAKEKGIAPIAVSDKNATANIDTTGEFPTYTFSDLNLGYYLVDSTMGALCGLTTTNPNASINAKNGEPTLNLHVQEDATGLWGTENTADIGDAVEYRITVFVQPGAENYTLHVELEDALTDPADIKVEYDGNTVAAAGNYTVKDSGFGDACDFEINFTEAFCDGLAAGKSLFVFYEATLNTNATIAGEGNKSVAQLQFGDTTDPHYATDSEVTTRTYAFDLVKTDKQNALLDGAYFKMYRMVAGNHELAQLIKVTDGSNFYYRPAMEGETGTVTEFEVEGGKIRFQGFDSDDYYFEETKAPDGYNILTDKVKFTLGTVNKDAIFNDGVYSSGSGFHITNQSGAMLPETGGLGTLLFTVLGGTTAMGTGVVLVTKKRMSKIKDED